MSSMDIYCSFRADVETGNGLKTLSMALDQLFKRTEWHLKEQAAKERSMLGLGLK
jgi:hypothetical protein